MPRFAIKRLPLNLSCSTEPASKAMCIRPELGEFELEADSMEDARLEAAPRVPADVPHMICPWNESHQKFTRAPSSSRGNDFVHTAILYRCYGNGFEEFVARCQKDSPQSGRFLSKDDAKADYLAHKSIADKKLEQAFEHLSAIEALGVVIDHSVEGDTHGLVDNGTYLELEQGPYVFTRKCKL